MRKVYELTTKAALLVFTHLDQISPHTMVHTHSVSSLGSNIELLRLPDNHEELSLPSDSLIPTSEESTLSNGTLLCYTLYHFRGG